MRENVNEEILYTIANNLEKVNAPIAIKGGLLLHASLSEHQSPINRKTMDIDANWINQPPNINDMQNILEQAVKLSYPDYTVTTHRPYGTQQSAGFHVLDEKGRILTHIDIDVQKETHPKNYTFTDKSFQGVEIEQVLCDKITVASSPKLFRRTKDLLDIYAITQSVPYDESKLTELLTKQKLGDFSILNTEKDKLEHGYNKLRDITNKPDFETVYQTTTEFCITIAQKARRLQRTKLAENTFNNLLQQQSPTDDFQKT